ncbi:MAG: 30S ribosomal protein S7 [Dehalococcoidia bacterium]|nr:MAG: 30S ribosomal protein S7 [Dehalococcoidia bacterium]
MPRRGRVIIRELPPDAKYDSVLVTKLISGVMMGGKKSTAERIVYDAMGVLEQQASKAPLDVLEEAIKNATPVLEVKPRRVGGATYQVPVEVAPRRGLSLAIRWLLKSARARTGRSMGERLAAELRDASKGEGATIKKREDVYRMAQANRAFAHYRW